MKGTIQRIISPACLVAMIVLTFALCSSTLLAEEGLQTTSAAIAGDNSTRPFVVYYSKTGNARMAAEALKKQLGCEMGEIASNSKKGVFTIMLDQLFNRDDDQKPFQQDLKGYNPIVLVTPIWFMKLSSPARTFIKQGHIKGKDVYIFTTSGGPMQKKKEAFKEFATSHGLNVKDVFSLQIGKKTQADYDKEIQTILEKIDIRKTAVEIQ